MIDDLSNWHRRGSKTLDKKWSKWRGPHPAAANLNSHCGRLTLSTRPFDFTRTTSPQIDSRLYSANVELFYKPVVLLANVVDNCILTRID
ncbi:hypothetical protein KIN20_005579 [Parelaphostrongylus tenuis]|uniref:Uncharacterized protein n=1 Tax=Parelaphostrongylus tenuis TaxID=148309 RepID=A0AAD5QFA0_PARTN|nr:hypothetical protein KIN20_005579 [Parelaphostrongylus tenuis]